MNQNTTYLRVTIHDNDFRSSLQIVCHAMYDIFSDEDKWPTEEDFPKIKEYIKHIWWGVHNAMNHMRWKNTCVVHHELDKSSGMDYLEPKLSFINFIEIPDWDNFESVYIPMFHDAEILLR